MTLTRYRRRPTHRPVAWVCDPWTMIDEEGRVRPLEAEPHAQLYADHDAARDWFVHERASALIRWEDRRIRWVSPEGVPVRLLKDAPPDAEAAAALFAVAEWVRSEGAEMSSMGSAGISLLRATLPAWAVIVPWKRNVPGFVPLGGRVGGHAITGPIPEPAVHLDLPAAYASTLGNLIWWDHFDRKDAPDADGRDSSPDLTPARLLRDRRQDRGRSQGPGGVLRSVLPPAGVPCLVEATVNVPGWLEAGPLPVRPQAQQTASERIWAPIREEPTYPVGRTLTGIWTREEIDAARAVGTGCEVTVHRVWTMPANARSRPFLPWWEAVQRGRALPGWAGTLAKQIGNATVGSLCLRQDGRLWRDRWEGQRKVSDELEVRHGPRHHLLYETVTGRVRARLWSEIMSVYGTDALFWHTDGAWVKEEAWRTSPIRANGSSAGGAAPHPDSRGRGTSPTSSPPSAPATVTDSWRVKHRAVAIDYLDPEAYAFTENGVTTQYVVAGERKDKAPAAFDERWSERVRDPARRQRCTPHLESRAA